MIDLKQDSYSELTQAMTTATTKEEQSRATLEHNYIYDGVFAQVVDTLVDMSLQTSYTITDNNEENQARLSELGLRHVLPEALKESRLYGGSVILVGQNVESLEQTQLPWINGTEITGLTIVCRFDVQVNHEIGTNEIISYVHNGLTYHPSRVIHINAFGFNSKSKLNYNGFSPSITERSYEALMRRDQLARGINALASKMGTLFYRGKDFLKMLKADAEGMALKRMSLLSANMNATDITPLDMDEEVFRMAMDFSNLDKLSETVNKQVAASSNIPYSILFSPDNVDTKSAGQYGKVVKEYRQNTISPIIKRLLDMENRTLKTTRVLFNVIEEADKVQDSLNMVNNVSSICSLYDRGIISMEEARNTLGSDGNYTTLVLDPNTDTKKLKPVQAIQAKPQHGTNT